MSFKIDLKIFIALIIFYFTKQLNIYFTIMLFAIIHELGHLCAGVVFGKKLKEIKINPFGVSILFNIDISEYNKKIKNANLVELKRIIIAIAGPLTNVFIIIIVKYLNIQSNIKELIIYSNMLIVMFNLLPIYPLDGGRILKGILYIAKGKFKAEKTQNNISNICIIILTAISSIAILYLKNISIFFIIMYLWVIVIRENRRYELKQNMIKLLKINKINSKLY